MKFFRNILILAVFMQLFFSCQSKNENRWQIAVDSKRDAVKVEDISRQFYNPKVPLSDFKEKYWFFQGNISDEDFAKRRQDTMEIHIYEEAVAKMDVPKLEKNLGELFAHVHYYFPKFQNPRVYLYSSALQGVMDPVFYLKDRHMLFIDISAFMGAEDQYYKGIPAYLRLSMQQEYLLPKVAQALAGALVIYNPEANQFLDKMIYYGKLLILQDAFLPTTADYLKMGYTAEQEKWARDYEGNIWNYFVENSLLFSDDPELNERFLSVAPFSKFYRKIDQESAPRIGSWIGWQICKTYLKKNPETKLKAFLKLDAQTIFNQANYRPED